MRLLARYSFVLCVLLILPCLMLYLKYNKTQTVVEILQSYTVNPGVKPAKTNTDCRIDSCLDKTHCGDRVRVYVYPPSDNSKRHPFHLIRAAIKNSMYYTSNFTEACLIFPPMDVLERSDPHIAEKLLASLPSWRGAGLNHVLVTDKEWDHHGNAVVFSSRLYTNNYRQQFDVSFPLINQRYSSLTISHSASRRWKLIVSQLSVSTNNREVLRGLEDDAHMMMLRRCLADDNQNMLCKDSVNFQYPSVLKDGDFCLIMKSQNHVGSLLMESLMMGCIPLIVMPDYILPFNEFIDWKRVAITIHEHQLSDVMDILTKVKEDEVVARRYQAFFLWKKYFSSAEKIVDTSIEVINQRLFVGQRKSYEEWNGQYGNIKGNKFYPGVTPPLFFPLQASPSKGFTAVILTYNRVPMLHKLMLQLQAVPSLKKILVVWNNPKSNPYENDWPKLSKSWQLKKSKINYLTNRFSTFKEIDTEAVLAVDDDILMLSSDEIEFAFQVWCEQPDRLVGFPARSFTVEDKLYKYQSEWQNHLSMVLTGAAFYHNLYNYLFTKILPVETRDYIDAKMNCEDIAMNFLIANLTGKPPIKVTPRKRFKCTGCSSNDSLWSETSHFIKRSQCLHHFTEHFSKMPLQRVEYRADPLLFHQDVPAQFKRFPDIGQV